MEFPPINDFKPPSRLLRRKYAGFAVALDLAVLGSLLGLAWISLNQISSHVAQSGLESDVFTLNGIVKSYLAAGGTLASAESASEVLVKLKRRRRSVDGGADAASSLALMDRRLVADMQTGREADLGMRRAVWKADLQRFELTNAGGPGVRAFVIDSSLGPIDFGLEVAEAAMKPVASTNIP